MSESTMSADALRAVANDVWNGGMAQALDSVEKANCVVSLSYLAVVQAKPNGMTLEEIRNHVPEAWRNRVTEAGFHADVRLASSVLKKHAEAVKAKSVILGEAVEESVLEFVSRIGSNRRASGALRDALGKPKQSKQSKQTAKPAKPAKDVTAKPVDPNGRSVRADILAVFGTMELTEAETLLAEIADVVSKRRAKASKPVTSKRSAKASTSKQ